MFGRVLLLCLIECGVVHGRRILALPRLPTHLESIVVKKASEVRGNPTNIILLKKSNLYRQNLPKQAVVPDPSWLSTGRKCITRLISVPFAQTFNKSIPVVVNDGSHEIQLAFTSSVTRAVAWRKQTKMEVCIDLGGGN